MDSAFPLLALIMRILIFAFIFTFIYWVLRAEQTLRPKIVLSKSGISSENSIVINFSSGLANRFFPPHILIGRHPSCEIVLDDKAISLRHARISFKDRGWWITDLKSRNGTFINSEKIDDRHLLTSDDEIRIGHEILSIY